MITNDAWRVWGNMMSVLLGLQIEIYCVALASKRLWSATFGNEVEPRTAILALHAIQEFFECMNDWSEIVFPKIGPLVVVDRFVDDPFFITLVTARFR